MDMDIKETAVSSHCYIKTMKWENKKQNTHTQTIFCGILKFSMGH